MYPQNFGGGGNRGPTPPFQSPPPHFNPNFYQNPNFYPPNPNFTYQSPYQIPPQNYPPQNPSFPVRSPSFRPGAPKPNEALEKVDRAVAKARIDLLAAGECASAWKVSQAALLILKSDSWESVGFQMQQIPSLYKLMVTERKINAFIHCFVGVQSMTSLYDLELGICENEGVNRFDDLEMGPLVKYPLVVHYFSVSSDVKEVFEITTERIVKFLRDFMHKTKVKKVTADELLDYIAEKRKVDGRDKLSVRIQNLGMYINMIRRAEMSQTKAADKCLEEIRRTSLEKKEKRPLFTSQKKEMDQQFDAISKRIDSFGKHIRFASSSSEEDSDNNEEEFTQNSQQEKVNPGSVDRVSNCPYPSANEERTRLGLGSGNDPSPSSPTANSTDPASKPCKRKRKREKLGSSSTGSHKLPKSENAKSDFLSGGDVEKGRSGFSLSDESIRLFLTTWKDASRENSVGEVLERMLNLYQLKKRKKIKQIFTSYPCIGLLNVAVKSMKSGMSDSIYDTFQNFGQKEVSKATSEKNTDCISIDVEPSGKNALISIQNVVTVEEILKKVSTYFEEDHDIIGNSTLPLEKIFNFLRKLCKLEHWLSDQFSVGEFSALGCGDFFTFIEKQVSQLGQALQSCIMTGDSSEKSCLEASIHQDQLTVLLSQANLEWENDVLINEKISQLLSWQFPSVYFKLKNGSIEDIKQIVTENKCNNFSNFILFSAPLFKKLELKEGKFGPVTKKDAIELLLRAPMLIDLESWSHWDLIYSPSLGPLIRWLINEVNNKELLCFFTRCGKILRIDHTSTVDSLLEGFLQDSFFQVALQLASLYSLYGGEQNVPLSLLKCHAQKGFEVLVKNYADAEESREHIFDKRNKDRVKKSTQVASNFVLNCLDFLPVELRSFAADVLLSGFKSVVKDAASAILNECNSTEHRLMIHEIGLSLGIVEWVHDYRNFCSASDSCSPSEKLDHELITVESSRKLLSSEHQVEHQVAVVYAEDNELNEECKTIDVGKGKDISGGILGKISEVEGGNLSAPLIIESIRREEFGLDPNLSVTESYMLKKQHARLGRALHCLSQELYSQDSHFLLELIQNADDNVYPDSVEPTLTFILLEGGIIVLNNENGFSGENIRALCDVGNSTKKGSNSGYIGKKGIGFKSVFRVSDAPEIHSNGFHIKFDISEGQIGFVLPTTVPPCDIQTFTKLASTDADEKIWNTCVVLPFRSTFSEGFSLENIISMFSDLHPSLLLFLHRLQCIKFRNTLNDSSVIMRKQILGEGIVKVSFGKEKMTWFVTSKKLQASHIRQDVQTTEISIAFTLEESSEGIYVPRLDPQPVFAFLPLRTYGLKFILQGDFVLPSSREEVDGDSPWNQWLLSEFPNLFVSSEESFCQIPCFSNDLGKGISSFMSFIPLIGEVHGFFSNLPRMIISKLRMSNCLLLDRENCEWVPPCKVLRNWDEQARTLLPENLIKEHLGLGFLKRDIMLSDSLARALGIEEYGPKILIQIISSLCSKENDLRSMGFEWLSLWLNSIYQMSSSNDSDLIASLRKIPFVPLSDGKFCAVDDGTVWLYSDTYGTENESQAKIFPKLYAKLRTVNQALFATHGGDRLDASTVENVTKMLCKVGVQKLSAHDIMKVHILPAISEENNTKNGTENSDLMIEYISFVMFHLQSSCPSCKLEREFIISELRSKSFVLTNHGFKRIADVAIHFSKDFKNPIDVDKLINGLNFEWYEIDKTYLSHPITKFISSGVQKWRIFFQELGVSDFVRVDQIEKPVADVFHLLQNITWEKEMISSESTAVDWESVELTRLLSLISTTRDHKRCKYLLEILDTLWDDKFSDKVYGYCKINSSGDNKPFKSSLISVLQDSKWISSSMAINELNFAKDLFHDCEAVQSILGFWAPYTAPKVKCEKLIKDIGFKTRVTLEDVFSVLDLWRTYKKTFKASISQMGRFYTFISNEIPTSRNIILEKLNIGPFIFVPDSSNPRFDEIVPGSFLTPEEVYWHDATGCMDQMKTLESGSGMQSPSSKMLCNIYPNLHDFFVKECGINEIPPLTSYFQILVQMSKVSLPSEAASTVVQVFVKLNEGYNSGLLSSDDIELFKKNLSKEEFTVLPSALDKWVSLHNSFGLVCWCDDESLKKEFKNCDDIDFIYFGEKQTETVLAAVSPLIRRLGIPFLSEITTREAINYGIADSSFKTSLVNWALPYAQRYIYSSFPNVYSELKLSGFDIINRMRILVFEQLYYKNVIKKANITPNKRHECSCLLKDNILYATTESDSHSIYMELSRMLLSGNPSFILGMANFLHMITTMAESGSTGDQIEHFILSCQKIPKLSEDESIWAVQSPPPSSDDDPAVIASSTSAIMDGISARSKKKTSSSWPPPDWRTAPGFNYARVNGFQTQQSFSPQMANNNQEQITEETHPTATFEINADWKIEEAPPGVVPTVTSPKSHEDQTVRISCDSNAEFETFDMNPTITNQQQLIITGREGEFVGYKYFLGKYGASLVKWVNEVRESGLPYDIILGNSEENREYIEVKSTKSPRKDWFNITLREWQFAVEKGDSFSIARIALLGNNTSRVTIYKNPVRLCQLGQMQLAIILPRQQQL